LLKTVRFELRSNDVPQSFPHLQLIGGGAPHSAIGDSLAIGGDLLVLGANSDGVDANLGNRVLCSMVAHSQHDIDREPPRCLATETCYRLGMPIKQALQSERLLAPSEISFRAILLRLCFGLLPGGALNNYRHGFLRQMTLNPRVAVVLTSW